MLLNVLPQCKLEEKQDCLSLTHTVWTINDVLGNRYPRNIYIYISPKKSLTVHTVCTRLWRTHSCISSSLHWVRTFNYIYHIHFLNCQIKILRKGKKAEKVRHILHPCLLSYSKMVTHVRASNHSKTFELPFQLQKELEVNLLLWNVNEKWMENKLETHLEHSIWVTFAFHVIPEVEAVVKVNVVPALERPCSM